MFRLKPTTLLLCLLGPAFGRSMVQAPQPEVDVCMRLAASVPFGLLAQSETTVTQLFQDIDVKIPWTSQSPKTNVAVRVSDQTPVDFHKGALAYALPYARRGDRVFVFYDRFAPLTISAPIAAAAVRTYLGP